jgi:hypothetical protein
LAHIVSPLSARKNTIYILHMQENSKGRPMAQMQIQRFL